MQKYLVEFVGTFFLVLTIALTALTGGGTPFAPIAIGVVLMTMIYMGGHVSGAHYNPAVTIGALIRRKIDFHDTILYIVAQVIGGVTALLITLAVAAPVASVIPQTVSLGKAMLAEFIFTFALVSVVLNVAYTKATEKNSYYGFAIGAVVMVGAFAVGDISGGAFNPAVSLSSMFMANSFEYAGGYIGTQVLAAITAAGYHYFTTEHKE